MNLNPNKILNRKSSSKHELRQALAQVLGVECPPFDKPKCEATGTCKALFIDFYEKKTNIDYSWQVKDVACLNHIIKKMYALTNATGNDEVVKGFNYMLENLPEWYVEHGLSLCVINSKFNEIIATIKNGRASKKGKSKVSDSYKAAIIRDLQS